MAAPIEDQMHQFLIAREEERCSEIEQENDKNEETRGNEVKRKTIPKPWTRPGPSTLCQEIYLLGMVGEFDYDLSDSAFQDYCCDRGVLHVAGEPGCRRWEYLSAHDGAKSRYLSDPYFQLAEEVDGKQYRFTDEELESGWMVILLARAKLQDCWEIYSKVQV